jgi:anthranilate phosphoribosyltransferase
MASNRALKVETPKQSRAMLMGVLDNQPGAARDIVMLNAGVALYAANVAGTMKDGMLGPVRPSNRALPRFGAQFVAATQTLAG